MAAVPAASVGTAADFAACVTAEQEVEQEFGAALGAADSVATP